MVLSEAITKAFEYEKEFTSLLEYVFYLRMIKKFENLFLPKRRIWPLFLRELSDKDYQNIVRVNTIDLNPDNVEKYTNDLMKRTINSPERKFMHTVRVLYRVSDTQIRILRDFDNYRNNIYFTDFEKGDQKCIRSGKSSSLEYLSYKESEKITNIGGPITQSPESYNDNGDLYYARQLADQLSAFCSLRDLKHATFWVVTGTPTIRATLVGTSEDSNFSDGHFITVPEFEPGASGRIYTKPHFNQQLYDELKTSNPRTIDPEYAIATLSKKLIEHVNYAESIFGKDSLEKHRKFAKSSVDMRYAGLINFNRNELENEVKAISEKIKKPKK